MGRLPLPREQRRQFWALIREGRTRREAAEQVGWSETSANWWFRQAGGVVPANVQATLSGRYLCIEEREEILAGVERWESIRSIAKGIGRAPSTVQRELRRNMRHQYRTGRASPASPAGLGLHPGTTDQAGPSIGPRGWLRGPSWPSWP
jgi:transposase